jgi:hypothetical protein
MATSVPSIVLRECAHLAARMGGSGRSLILNGLAIAVVSFGLPWYVGPAFLTALVVIPLACLSVFLAADLVADSFASPIADVREFVGRAAACVLIGWAGGLAMLFAGLLVMNALNWSGELALPPAIILIDAALLSFAASVFVAGAAVCVGRQSQSARTARLALKLAMLFVTVLLMYGCNRLQISGRLFLTHSRITRLTWMASVFFLANGCALVAFGASYLQPRHPKTPVGSA